MCRREQDEKVCLAFHLEEIFSALDKAGVEQLEGQSRQDVEAFLLQSKFSKKSQQYFLSSESNDTVIRRGPGCNITHQNWNVPRHLLG